MRAAGRAAAAGSVAEAGAVVAELERRGELWCPAPGLTGLRGAALELYGRIEGAVAALAGEETGEAWGVPAGLAFETLARAGTLSSFPQWLTAASHLGGGPGTLEAVARAKDPVGTARRSLAPAGAVLPPAACYHVYEALRGSALAGPRLITLQCTCWRHEGARTAPLERGWAFTMREVVCLADTSRVEAFRSRGIERALRLARALGLEPSVEEATDPFFAPTARGRALLQRLRALKHELLLPVGGGRRLAATSFNHHERFFGEAFAILLPGGEPAATGCVAYGIERWLLAFLCAHGVHPSGWPEVPAVRAMPEVREVPKVPTVPTVPAVPTASVADTPKRLP